MKFKLLKLKEGYESDDFQSHLFGSPDVLKEWNDQDQSCFNNDEVFFLQLNLKDLNLKELPNEGILMFTICTLSHPFRGIVRYFNNFNNSERIDFNDEDSIYNLNQEYELIIDDTSNELEILGNMPKFKEYHPTKNERCLLTFNKTLFKEIDLFNDYEEDYVSFVIKEDDLLNHKFEQAKLAANLD